jgi:hypothetical protein
MDAEDREFMRKLLLRAHRREFVAEMQAQRRVLFRVLDHLDGRSA